LHPPRRQALVPRSALVDRLDASSESITVVVAPPGYGKTTLLSEWSQRDPSRFAWLSLDRHDNDLARLASYAHAALDRVEPIDSEIARPPTLQGSVAAVASHVASSMQMKEPVTLVLDHVELLHNDECLDTLTELALHLPAGARLALATRTEPPLPMARLRAGREVVEVGVDDLAMTRHEADALLEVAGVALTDANVEQLLERTEGWPVGLYLAALAMKAGGAHETMAVPFSGNDRLMAEYLRAELLSHLSDAEVTFLTRTAVLDRMSGPLCDAVLERSGSATVLESLARSNLLLVALDRREEWYRYHHLFQDLLRVELDRREPDVVPALHHRAAMWFETNRMPESAMDHAQAAGDPEHVSRLMIANAHTAFAAGHAETVRRWATWFEDTGLLTRFPAVAVLGAMFYTNIGDAGAAERWSTAAQQEDTAPASLPDGGTPSSQASPEWITPDGSSMEGLRALVRAHQSRDGIEAMRRDAESAIAGLNKTSPFHCSALTLQGVAVLLGGDQREADLIFARAVDVGAGAFTWPAMIVALAERGLCAIVRGDTAAAESFLVEALSRVQASGLEPYAESALVFAVAARAALTRRDVTRAGEYVTRVTRLRPLLTYARPAFSVQTLLELARTCAALDDTAGAREALRHARGVLQHRPGLGVLSTQIDELATRLDTMQTGRLGASSLTAAELRLLPFLPSHLTYPQVAARLYVSRNTVKSQVISIYQKLGVSSREDAVERLREIGLIEI
jgi:LuxR family maltose regulon positive regulatory protein